MDPNIRGTVRVAWFNLDRQTDVRSASARVRQSFSRIALMDGVF